MDNSDRISSEGLLTAAEVEDIRAQAEYQLHLLQAGEWRPSPRPRTLPPPDPDQDRIARCPCHGAWAWAGRCTTKLRIR